ncbi:hypothetical protein [Streptomyces yaizuensis]|uniref:Uncharacterized protein n=1 Tax=Streptomyces yaizuensis TaxID=2989713 RepID=A0ABQ5P3A1_9ACTN|nr:hypothetical protein [Streptomyces sp. YSPA8]GLF96982.1 hypothetical protein SYYSPA8_21815 [Streptomyces sp. YSPA8]
MSDVFTFPVLAASALTQAFGFLYRRAETLLDRRRGNASQPETVPAVVVGDPGSAEADGDALTPERLEQLESLWEVLGVYGDHQDLVRPEDERLRRNLGQLRGLLEEIYGRRITFEGEDRARSGTRIVQNLGQVHGSAHALKVQTIGRDAAVEVEQKAEVLHRGASVTAAEINLIE